MMMPLKDTLANRTWRELRVTSYAHEWKFDAQQSKAEAYHHLCNRLDDHEYLKRVYRRLGEAEQLALQHVQAAGGSLALYKFRLLHGDIRPYRPWDAEEPRHPWRYPVSAAERLWFLGLIEIIEGRPDQVVVPAEVLAILPPLPKANPFPEAVIPTEAAWQHGDILRDVATLLGLLQGENVRPIWGRWLPLRVLHRLNQHLSHAEDLSATRSELHTQRLRMVHYLAEVAGLVGMQGGYLKPTVRAWAWLEQGPAEQWRQVEGAWHRDLGRRHAHWTAYRLPELPPQMWQALWSQLAGLDKGATYEWVSVVRALRPYALGDDYLLDAALQIVRGPLAWLGLVRVEGRCLWQTTVEQWSVSQDARLVNQPDALWVQLPPRPHARPYAELLSWAGGDGRGLWVDAEAVRRAVQLGYDAQGVAQVLARLQGAALPTSVYKRLVAWEQQAQQLVVENMVVLTAADSQQLAAIRHDPHLRPLVRETLSAHRVALAPHAVNEMKSRLARRGLTVTSTTPEPLPKTIAEEAMTPALAEYLWLAVNVYRGLADMVQLPVQIPAAVEQWLAGHLPDEQPDHLAQMSAAMVADLRRTLAGYTSVGGVVADDDLDTVRGALTQAYEQAAAVTVDYFSPAQGQVVRRTIEPLLPLTVQHGAEYVEAWCQLEQDTRTFRVDRVVRVVAT